MIWRLCVVTYQRENCRTSDQQHDETDQDELIDVIGLHGNQHPGDEVINNGSSAAGKTDLRMLFSCFTEFSVNKTIYDLFLILSPFSKECIRQWQLYKAENGQS